MVGVGDMANMHVFSWALCYDMANMHVVAGYDITAMIDIYGYDMAMVWTVRSLKQHNMRSE